jgi:hypothetical protein
MVLQNGETSGFGEKESSLGMVLQNWERKGLERKRVNSE